MSAGSWAVRMLRLPKGAEGPDLVGSFRLPSGELAVIEVDVDAAPRCGAQTVDGSGTREHCFHYNEEKRECCSCGAAPEVSGE